MKSKFKKKLTLFVEENGFVNSVLINNKDKSVAYPDIGEEKNRFFQEMISFFKNNTGENAHILFYSQDSCVYMLKTNKGVYICECQRNTSPSQIKMEFNTFVEDFENQGNFSSLFSTFFDR